MRTKGKILIGQLLIAFTATLFGQPISVVSNPEAEIIESTIFQLKERLVRMERELKKRGKADTTLVHDINALRAETNNLEMSLLEVVFADLRQTGSVLEIAQLDTSSQMDSNVRKAQIREVMPFVIRDTVSYKIVWYCDARYMSHLLILEGQEFKVKGFNFSVERIDWKPGGTDAVKSRQIKSYCPESQSEIEIKAFYSDAILHQVIPQLGNHYYKGCNTQVLVSDVPNVVMFTVNDNNYADNDGGYMVMLNGWW